MATIFLPHPMASDPTALEPTDPEGAAGLLHDLRGCCGLEFGAYREASLLRRVRQRMHQLGIAAFSAYRALLADDPEEIARLCEAVPVHFTGFFRDPGIWDHLASQVLPATLAAKRGDAPVRVWSAGCATGEEAYSLAMLLAEAARNAGWASGRIRAFGTDVGEAALARARAGRYSDWSTDDVPARLKEAYFRRDGDAWKARPELRDLILFNRHDLLCDPPFGHLDLIVCRNTLMYFNPAAQARVLAGFYLALKPGGALLTGWAEHGASWGGLFQSPDPSYRIYYRVEGRMTEALSLLDLRDFGPRRWGP